MENFPEKKQGCIFLRLLVTKHFPSVYYHVLKDKEMAPNRVN